MQPMKQTMAMGAFESNLGTRRDIFLLQIHETEPLKFYISSLTQQAITWSVTKCKLI